MTVGENRVRNAESFCIKKGKHVSSFLILLFTSTTPNIFLYICCPLKAVVNSFALLPLLAPLYRGNFVDFSFYYKKLLPK